MAGLLKSLADNPQPMVFAGLALIILTPFAFRWFRNDRVEIRFVILVMFFVGVAVVLFGIRPTHVPAKQVAPQPSGEQTSTASTLETPIEPTGMSSPKNSPSTNFSESGDDPVADQELDDSKFAPHSDEEIFGVWVRLSSRRKTECGLYRVLNSNPTDARGWKTARILCREGSRWTFATNNIDGGWLRQVQTKGGEEVEPEWRDEDGDGFIDYCRAVGNRGASTGNVSYESCLYGPNFNRDIATGR